MDSFEKQPYEEWPIAVDFSPRLPAGTTIATMVVSAKLEADNSNQGETVLDASNATINGNIVIVGVKGGVNLADYIISFRGTLSPSGKVETDLRMRVRDDN